LERQVGRQGAALVGGDAFGGEFERAAEVRGGAAVTGAALGVGNAEVAAGEPDAVKASGVVPEGAVAARPHVGEDARDDGLRGQGAAEDRSHAGAVLGGIELLQRREAVRESGGGASAGATLRAVYAQR
jgi:hypothetical protein